MNNEVLYVAKRTMLTSKFMLSILGLVVGMIILILGFVVMKSVGPYITFLGLVIIVISGILCLCEGLVMRSNTLEFYKTKYVIKSGVINKHEKEVLLTNLLSVSLSQTLSGRLLDYGTVKINLIGKHDISLSGVKHPHELKKYIEGLLNKTDVNSLNQIIQD